MSSGELGGSLEALEGRAPVTSPPANPARRSEGHAEAGDDSDDDDHSDHEVDSDDADEEEEREEEEEDEEEEEGEDVDAAAALAGAARSIPEENAAVAAAAAAENTPEGFHGAGKNAPGGSPPARWGGSDSYWHGQGGAVSSPLVGLSYANSPRSGLDLAAAGHESAGGEDVGMEAGAGVRAGAGAGGAVV